MARRHRSDRSQGGGDSGAFNASAIRAILDQAGCVGLRYYRGRTQGGDAAMILVGVDSDGNNMSDGILVDSHFPCPPYCPDDDDLTS